MLKKLLVFAIIAYCLVPGASHAATVGFVPSNGIWFSTSTVTPHQSVWIYSVIVNSEYAKLDGVLEFYDNNELIDSVSVKSLPKDTAKQVKVLWTPEAGDHALDARFTKVVGYDEKGATQTVADAQVNSTLGVGGGAEVTVVAKDNTLSIGPKVAVETPVSSSSPIMGAVSTISSWFSKNRDALSQAQGAVHTITSTAQSANNAYAQTKAAIDTGAQYYDKAHAALVKVQPALDAAAPMWDVLSDHNNPKRIAIIIGAVLVLYFILRLTGRRRERFD